AYLLAHFLDGVLDLFADLLEVLLELLLDLGHAPHGVVDRLADLPAQVPGELLPLGLVVPVPAGAFLRPAPGAGLFPRSALRRTRLARPCACSGCAGGSLSRCSARLRCGRTRAGSRGAALPGVPGLLRGLAGAGGIAGFQGIQQRRRFLCTDLSFFQHLQNKKTLFVHAVAPPFTWSVWLVVCADPWSAP